MDYRLYAGYELSDTVENWSLTDKDKQIIDICVYMVDNKISLSKLSDEFEIPKSTLYGRIKRDLPKLSYELYMVVRKQLRTNKQQYFKGRF